MTGVSVRGLFVIALAMLAATATVASANVASGVQLGKIVLRASQIGPGYKLLQRPDGHGAAGFVTLDMCGYDFMSEVARTDRLQVDYSKAGAAIKYSNEVVSYVPGGTRFALMELNRAVSQCPHTPVASTVKGVPPLTYRITRLPTAGLLPGAVALSVKVSGVYKAKPFSETDVAIYQVRADVLSGLYAYGGTAAARNSAALHAAKQSRANLIG